MLKFLFKILVPILWVSSSNAIAPSVPLQVWTNEAVINIYTFTSKNYQLRQQDIAQYFTPETWQAYRIKLNKSKIFKEIRTHDYTVSAVATHPPTIKMDATKHIAAEMPILVTYTNAEKTISQNLKITLKLIHTKSLGVREYAIEQFQAVNTGEPCRCSGSPSPKVTIA